MRTPLISHEDTPNITQICCIDRHPARDGFFGFVNESALVGFLESRRSLGGEHSAVGCQRLMQLLWVTSRRQVVELVVLASEGYPRHCVR